MAQPSEVDKSSAREEMGKGMAPTATSAKSTLGDRSAAIPKGSLVVMPSKRGSSTLGVSLAKRVRKTTTRAAGPAGTRPSSGCPEASDAGLSGVKAPEAFGSPVFMTPDFPEAGGQAEVSAVDPLPDFLGGDSDLEGHVGDNSKGWTTAPIRRANLVEVMVKTPLPSSEALVLVADPPTALSFVAAAAGQADDAGSIHAATGTPPRPPPVASAGGEDPAAGASDATIASWAESLHAVNAEIGERFRYAMRGLDFSISFG